MMRGTTLSGHWSTRHSHTGRSPDTYVCSPGGIIRIKNESVPKITINDTIFFLKVQSAFW